METYKNEIPEIILNDDSFLFHGSSNISESELDKGIASNFSFVTQEIVEKIVTIFNDMSWRGNHGGGYAVLSTFSKTDIHPKKGKFFFLGETITRCKTFASEDFAGGELIRSLYYSIRDLQYYINDSKLRKEHEAQMERESIYTKTINKYDLMSLKNEVDLLGQIFKEILSIRAAYKYGIIYCYKIEESDYQLLNNRGGMGIIVKDSLPASRLKSKLIFEKDFIENFIGLNDNNLMFEKTLTWNKRIKSF